MSETVLDPLFHLAFVTGLLLAFVLPLLGTLLMLREEWLAALGLAHLAAAGALVGLAIGVAAPIGGLLAALGGGSAKALLGVRGNAAYVFMILAGWSALLLIAANTAIGDALGHALIEGQLYFAGPVDLGAAVLLTSIAILTLPWLVPRLLRARLFPHHEIANRCGSLAVLSPQRSFGAPAPRRIAPAPKRASIRSSVAIRRSLRSSAFRGA